MELKDISFGLGSITFKPEQEAVPDSSETQGIVTINRSGRPSTPAYFSVSNYITCQFECEGIQTTEFFNWSVVVPGFEASAAYNEVEMAAAGKLAPMLRAVADKIEANLADAAAENAGGASTDP